MSQANKYLNNTIRGRYNDDTPDAVLSKVASNLLVTQEELGYILINTKDFPPNTVQESKYACYDFTYSMDKYMIFSDIFYSIGFEKFDDVRKTYKATIRHFLIKTEGSIWVKQYVYNYPRSIFTLSSIDRANYTKELMKLPPYDEFVTYYSSVYALKTKSPSLPLACDIGIGAGCFKSEFDYYLKSYNDLTLFGDMSPKITQDKQDIINAFYYLTGEDITSIGYNSSTQTANQNYLYSHMLMNKNYSTGAGSLQQGPYLHYVADNKLIADNQTNVDTETLSPGSSLKEPPSQEGSGGTQQPPSQEGNGGSSGYITPISQGGSEPNENNIPVEYPMDISISGIGDDAGRIYIDDYIDEIRKEKCYVDDQLY